VAAADGSMGLLSESVFTALVSPSCAAAGATSPAPCAAPDAAAEVPGSATTTLLGSNPLESSAKDWLSKTRRLEVQAFRAATCMMHFSGSCVSACIQVHEGFTQVKIASLTSTPRRSFFLEPIFPM
jgi:hypothetical protein